MAEVNMIQFAANIVLAAMWALFLDRTLEARFSRWLGAALWMAVACGWFAVIAFFLPFGSAARAFVGPGLCLLAALLCCKSGVVRAVFSVGLTQVVMILCEFVLMLLFPELRELTADTNGLSHFDSLTQLSMFLIYLPLNAMLLYLASFLFGRYKTVLSGRDWLLYTLFPASQMVLYFSWFVLMAQGFTAEAVVWQGIAVLVCVGVDAALYFSMRGMAKRATLKAENELLEKQIDAQKEHYSALTEQYESVRRMRHDIANHVHTIQILLEKGDTTEAAVYAAELHPQTAFTSSLGQCENPIADAFLYSRVTELRGQEIDVTAEVTLPAYMSISNGDLIIAFGNLLDNATEACGALQVSGLPFGRAS